nr:sensor histidine kinase [Pseudovibrio flavus]
MGSAFVVILSIIYIGLWTYAKESANQSYDRLLKSAALSILERSFVSHGKPSVDIPYSAMETLGLAPNDRVFYRVFTVTGGTITGSDDLPLPDDYEPSSEPEFFDRSYSGEPMRFIVQARYLRGAGYSGWVVVELGQTRLARSELEFDLIQNGLGVATLITIVGLIFVWFGINKALHPLIGIEAELRQRDTTDLTPLKPQSPREVASLIGSINGFIERLRKSLDHSQTFIADVAHQTRTSLSTLQGQLELAREQDNLPEMRERISRVEDQTRRTIRLTNQLISHAMVIHRADNQVMQAVDLCQLAKDVLEQTLRDYMASKVEFEFSCVGEEEEDLTPIWGDPIAIREALRNLLHNAVQHGPEINHIELRVAADKGSVSVCVDDAGEGIPEDMRAAALERFRSLGERRANSGLGLSIVSAVAQTHGAELVLTQSPLGGLRVSMRFKKGADACVA